MILNICSITVTWSSKPNDSGIISFKRLANKTTYCPKRTCMEDMDHEYQQVTIKCMVLISSRQTVGKLPIERLEEMQTLIYLLLLLGFRYPGKEDTNRCALKAAPPFLKALRALHDSMHG